jgi:predicted phosphohydrolase
MKKFFESHNLANFDIVHNTAIETETCIICGTRGWGKTEGNTQEEDQKIIAREEVRLENSLKAGIILKQKAKEEKGIEKPIIVALHFPPFVGRFQEIMEGYGVKTCIYGHLHGYAHNFVREGLIGNIEYKMVGCDYTKMKLVKID